MPGSASACSRQLERSGALGRAGLPGWTTQRFRPPPQCSASNAKSSPIFFLTSASWSTKLWPLWPRRRSSATTDAARPQDSDMKKVFEVCQDGKVRIVGAVVTGNAQG